MSSNIVSWPSATGTVLVKLETMMQLSTLLLLLTIIFSHAASTAAAPIGSAILILGDSLSAAHNISTEQSWPVLFQHKLESQNLEIAVINASISGETTGGGLDRLENLLNQHNPAYLILELGGNDGLLGYQFRQTQQNLEAMLNLALDQNIRVLMISTRLPPNLGPAYNQRYQNIFEHLAQKLPIVYLPQFLLGIAVGDARYMQPDGIHPTALAQPLLAEKVFKVFQKQLLDNS